jgi:hypothetical protein
MITNPSYSSVYNMCLNSEFHTFAQIIILLLICQGIFTAENVRKALNEFRII